MRLLLPMTNNPQIILLIANSVLNSGTIYPVAGIPPLKYSIVISMPLIMLSWGTVWTLDLLLFWHVSLGCIYLIPPLDYKLIFIYFCKLIEGRDYVFIIFLCLQYLVTSMKWGLEPAWVWGWGFMGPSVSIVWQHLWRQPDCQEWVLKLCFVLFFLLFLSLLLLPVSRCNFETNCIYVTFHLEITISECAVNLHSLSFPCYAPTPYVHLFT